MYTYHYGPPNYIRDVPDSIISLYHIPILEWLGNKCGSWNGYQKGMCLKEIGLHAQNMLTILSLIVNIIDGIHIYDHVTKTRIFTLIMYNIFV